MHSNKENPVDVAHAGHIYAVIGLKDTTTGDTLSAMDKPIVLESMTFPAPVIQVAVEPKSKADQEKMGVAIQKLAEEDPTFTVELDAETGQTIIGGMGELHLDIIVDRMRREFKVEANVGNPMVAYRETIRKTVEKYEYTHKKQTGGSGQFARVIIALEPLPADSEEEYMFEDKVTGGRVPREYIPSVDAGIKDAMQSGVLAGYPMVDIKATLLDGAYHEVDSSETGVQGCWLDGAERKLLRRLTPSSSSRSWPLRFVLPRSTWATSSATSTLAVARSRRWTSSTACALSRLRSRCPRCSDTLATCAPRRRAALSTPWSSTATPRFRAPSRTRSSASLGATESHRGLAGQVICPASRLTHK